MMNTSELLENLEETYPNFLKVYPETYCFRLSSNLVVSTDLN